LCCKKRRRRRRCCATQEVPKNKKCWALMPGAWAVWREMQLYEWRRMMTFRG
jgi:hypothetical protein